MLGGAKLMQAFGVEHFVGVFDYPMLRVYKRIGASPDLLGASGPSRTDIGVGLWHFSEGSQRSLLARSGVTLGEIDWCLQVLSTQPNPSDSPKSPDLSRPQPTKVEGLSLYLRAGSSVIIVDFRKGLLLTGRASLTRDPLAHDLVYAQGLVAAAMQLRSPFGTVTFGGPCSNIWANRSPGERRMRSSYWVVTVSPTTRLTVAAFVKPPKNSEEPGYLSIASSVTELQL